MDYPILNINEIPDLNNMIGAMGTSIGQASNIGSEELLLIVATYFWENSQAMSMLF